MTTVQFLIPVAQDGNVTTETREGVVCLLKLEEKRIRCVMHEGRLSDYRTGYGFGSFLNRKALRFASNPYARKLTDREAAQDLLDSIVARVGAAKVFAVLAKPATLNS